MKPIETKYKGYRFRSRLEARWAVFFDNLGIEWEYEPEGYELSNGQWYLPDFYIRNKNAYIEIKGGKATPKEIKNCALLGGELNTTDLLATGTPGLIWDVFSKIANMCDEYYGRKSTLEEKKSALKKAQKEVDEKMKCYLIEKGINGDVLFCGKIGKSWSSVQIDIYSLFSYISGCAPSQKLKEKVDSAIIKAKSARFEHGENG